MGVALTGMNGQSSWARQLLRMTNDEVDWNHRVAVNAHVVMEDIQVEPEFNENHRFPEPVMYLAGRVKDIRGDFGYGVSRVVFDDDLKGGNFPDVRFRWAFTPKEAAQLYALGLGTKDFKVPDYLTGIEYDLPMEVSVDTIVPTNNGSDVPIMVVNVMDDGAIPMDTKKSGYNQFVTRYMEPSPTMKEHAEELSEFNKSFHADHSMYYGMRVLESAAAEQDFSELFEDQVAMPSITTPDIESMISEPEISPEKALATDLINELDAQDEANLESPIDDEIMAEDPSVESTLAGLETPDETVTFEGVFGFEDAEDTIPEETVEIPELDEVEEDFDFSEMLFGDEIDNSTSVDAGDSKDESELDASELAQRNARRRAAEAAQMEVLQEPEIVELEVPDILDFGDDSNELER